LVRPEASQLTRPVSTLRHDLLEIVHAAIAAADARTLVRRALQDTRLLDVLQRVPRVDVLAVGKAASPMLSAFSSEPHVSVGSTLAAGLPDAGHPVPDERSVAVAIKALELARGVSGSGPFVVLLSGGASSLMALPSGYVTLEAKQETIRTLLSRGADIHELNTVRKHLSGIKGGQLAAACPAPVLTLAISDVVGDDLAVIGSGPTVADPSTFHDALEVLDARGGRGAYPANAVSVLESGAAGEAPETPKPGAPWFMQSVARVIGGAADALNGARSTAESLGYTVRTIERPLTGEARTAAAAYAQQVAALGAALPRPLCVLSFGETTVNVTGDGKGGRNQEFALGLVSLLDTLGPCVVAASVGTDGVDGPTNAAGAIIDSTTSSRAAANKLVPDRYLADNNSYEFFRALDDLIVIGPTDTNVGDIQIVLLDDASG
jgi:glycerate 2-kinase